MHVVTSKIATKIAYGHPAVVFAANETKTLTDEDFNRLAENKEGAFARHLKNGGLVDVQKQDAPLAAEDPRKQDATDDPRKQDATDDPRKQDATDDPRKQRPGEKKPAYDARIAALDAADADKKFTDDFFALAEADQSAFYATLDDKQKALVDKARDKK